MRRRGKILSLVFPLDRRANMVNRMQQSSAMGNPSEMPVEGRGGSFISLRFERPVPASLTDHHLMFKLIDNSSDFSSNTVI
jgi:hypothetical protein